MTLRHKRQHTHTPGNAPPSRPSACGTHTDPTRYLASTSRADGATHHEPLAPRNAEVPAGTIYTCPMHPEIRQIGPGHCPKCGMVLEPLMPTQIEDDSEIRSVRRRFWSALALAIPVMLIAMVPHLFGKTPDPTTAWTLRVLEL